MFSLSLLIINGCDKPAVTELTQDEEQLEVEVLTKYTDDEYYAADSSGVVDDLKRYTNVVTVSGLKITRGSATINAAFAQAIFFDKRFQVESPDGRLIGFRTRILGDVKFNDVNTRLSEYRIKFKNRNNGTHKDTLLGYRHVLNSLFPLQDFNYHYSSLVAFDLDLLPILGGSSISFNIPTPSEITGIVRFEGKRTDKTLKAILAWNGENHTNFEIIVGASVRNSENTFPLFRLKTNDDGGLIVPSELINKIPPEFDRVVINLVRKLESYHENNNNELYILSQSIHSLVIDIP